jgi:hypothetical protein
MDRSVVRLLVLCVGVSVGLGTFGATRLLAASCNPLAGTPCARVLFLGNSYTLANDLPAVFRDLARGAGRNVETGMVAGGGETLADHAASSETAGAIGGSHWEFVVLQEQSQIPSLESARRSQMYPAARSLVAAIRTAGATPVLLETWAHRDGWPENGLDYGAMQAAIDEGYTTIGRELSVGVAPVGEAWQTTLRQHPTIALWQEDGSHPSIAGTYLAACVLYVRIFNASPVGIPVTDGLAPDIAGALQAIASQG